MNSKQILIYVGVSGLAFFVGAYWQKSRMYFPANPQEAELLRSGAPLRLVVRT